MNALLSPQSIRERAKARGEPAWLADARVQAHERYAALPPPAFRRTELTGFNVEAAAWKAFGREAPVRRAFAKAEGVHLPLAEAAREHRDLVEHLARLSDRADKWEALQAALWSDGSLLFVEKGRELSATLDASVILPPEGALLRELVALAPRAKADVLARASGAAPGALVAQAIEMDVADGAQLSLSTLQDVDRTALMLGWRRAHVRRDARLSWIDGQFGAGTSVVANESLLDGPGAGVAFVGAFFGSSKQHMDITTAALHAAPHTSSQLDMKGALNDDGYSANYSIVFIGPEARNASGHQHQETLVLSEGARADAIPKLDVENNEVSASHGASVGQLDPEQVFYLRARGLDEQAATRVIVEGFFEPLLSKIPVESVREEIRGAIVARLKK